MKPLTNRNRTSRQRSRGHALIMVVVVLTLSTAILTTAVRSTLVRYQSVERNATRQQTDCLAESALQLGMVRYQLDPAEPEGEWTTEIPDYGKAHVLLSVEQSEAGVQQLRVSVVLPVDGPVTSQVRIDRIRALPALNLPEPE